MSTYSLIKEIVSGKTEVSKIVLGDSVNLSTRLCVATLIYESKKESHEKRVNEVCQTFDKIYRIIVEHDIRMPENEFMVEKVIEKLKEEGESASVMNVTSGIEPSVPRIKRKKDDAEV